MDRAREPPHGRARRRRRRADGSGRPGRGGRELVRRTARRAVSPRHVVHAAHSGPRGTHGSPRTVAGGQPYLGRGCRGLAGARVPRRDPFGRSARGRDPPTHATRGDRPHPVRAMDDRARRRVDPMTTSPPPSPGPRAWGSTWLVAGVLLGVAAWAMPSAIQAGDAGEFATVMLRGGVPHPSGYPWMRILGWPARALEVLG